jgi:ATP-dependent Clp protease ATP-binding subunit ClpA
MPTKIDDKASAEIALARVRELEAHHHDVLAALETACRRGDAEKMIALRRELPGLNDDLKDATARWLAARFHAAQSEVEELDRRITAKRAELAKAEHQVRQSQEHVARANVGMNQHFLTGRSGVLFGTGGPGVEEYQQRQRHAATISAELHTLTTAHKNVSQEIERTRRELAAWLDRD